MSKSKRFIIKEIQKNPRLYAILDTWKRKYVRHLQDEDAPVITSPFQHDLTKIKDRLRHDK